METTDRNLAASEMAAAIQSYPLLLILAGAEGWGPDYISGSTPYNFDNMTANRIIDDLVKHVLVLSKKGKHKPPFPMDTAYQMLIIVEGEIDDIWENAIIKEVGLSSKIVDPESDWKNAALSYFDENCGQFEAIQREYLTDDKLYWLDPGQGKRDFYSRLFAKCLQPHFQNYKLSIKGRTLYEGFRAYKKLRLTDQ